MAWCSVKTQGNFIFYLQFYKAIDRNIVNFNLFVFAKEMRGQARASTELN
jgi:hypothetical protein